MKSITLFDGMKIAYQEWGASTASSGGTVKRILAMHGWLDNSNTFSYQGPYLAEKGYHVVAMDHAGHGFSDHVPRGANYSSQKNTAYAVDFLNKLQWKKAVIVGHSMSAGIGMLLAGSFPEVVDKLVLIEGFGPLTFPAATAAKSLRKGIESERTFYEKEASTKFYNDLEHAVTARLRTVSTYPGAQYLSYDGAKSLVSRGARYVGEEESYEHLTDESKGPIAFRHDPRCLGSSYVYYNNDQVLSFVNGITAQTLLITAEKGWPTDGCEADYKKRLEVLESKKLLTIKKLPGSHHLHLDPGDREECAKAVEDFLLIDLYRLE